MHLHLGKDKYFFSLYLGKHTQNWENKHIFGLGMPPITGGKTGQIKSL